MTFARLGKTGLQVCPLVFGTLPLGPLQADLEPADAARLIRHALEKGVNLFDTAELYGTYPHLRAGLEGCGDEVLVASKTHAPDGPGARAHVEKGLREMGRERFDIVHLHGARIADPFVERAEVFEELLRMKEEGKVGCVGLSSHFVGAMRKSLDHPEVEVLHPLINRRGMGIIDGSAAEMADVLEAAAAAGKGIYAMKALAGGNLIAEARASIAWVRDLPGIHAIALGMLDAEEVDANLELLVNDRAEAARWEKLQGRRRRLKIMDRFCKGCGACIPACAQGGLEIVDGRASVDEDNCILCGYCAAACPEFLIRVV